MTEDDQIIAVAREIITHFEGCHLHSYIYPGEKQYTIGWGHAYPLSEGPKTWTQEQADKQLAGDISSRLLALKKEIKPDIWQTLTINAKGAILSFRYNAVVSLWLSSTSRALLNSGRIAEFWDMVDEWNNHATAGLVRRRACERHCGERNSLQEVKDLKWYTDLIPRVNIVRKGHLYWVGPRLVWK